MFDSTLTLSRVGIILNIEADMNDVLFIPGVDYRYKNFITLFKDSQTTLLQQFLDKVFATLRLQTIEFFNGASFYQLKCVVTQPGQALCIVTNKTNSRKALSSLEDHNFKTLVDAYADSVWSFDTNFSLITANRTFLEVRRKANKNEVLRLGDNIFKYAPPAMYKKWMPIYERALKGEIICFEEKRNNGQRDYFVEIYLTPVYNEKNDIIGCMGITRDITERKNTQLEIAGYTSKLEEFAFKTSHDLRRPIANIIGITNLLSNTDLSEEERSQAISYISQSVGELDDIVISMIDLIDGRKNNGENQD